MEIKRDYYLNKLVLKQNNVAIDHIIKVAFDSFENIKYCDPEVFYPFIKEQIVDKEQYYIILDEIQLLGQFESVLNGLMRIPNAHESPIIF